jgi:hypothetical protein
MPVGVFWSETVLTTGVMAPTRIYVFGGCNDTRFSRTNLTQVYDLKNDSWSVGEPMTFTRWNFGAANANDFIYVFGGVNYTTNAITVNERYIPIEYGEIHSLPAPSLSPSPILTPQPSNSPTQQPTIEPSLTASPTEPMHSIPPLPYSLIITIAVVTIAAIVAAGLFVSLAKRRGK